MAEEVFEKSKELKKLSASLKNDLAKLMVAFDVPEGHIFIEEGSPIHSFFVVESGVLIRTKLRSGEGNDDEGCILIDEIGPGKVTGFLHVAGHDDDLAFATIAAGVGGAKVWAVDGSRFRLMCEENPQVSAMALDEPPDTLSPLSLRDLIILLVRTKACIRSHQSSHV